MQELLVILIRYLPSISLGNFDPEVSQALYVFMIVFFVFVLLVLIGFTRRHIIETSLRGFWAGLWTGVVIIGVLGGTVLWGTRNFIFGKKLALLPSGFQSVLFARRDDITGVLGIATEREQPTAQSVMAEYKLLSPIDLELVNNSVCQDKND